MSDNLRAQVTWRKSSFSAVNGGTDDCVEVAALSPGRTAVRDSKDSDGPVITCAAAAWAAFIDGVRAGDFD